MLPLGDMDYSVQDLDAKFLNIRAFPFVNGISIQNDRFPLPFRWSLMSCGPDNFPGLIQDRSIGIFPTFGEIFLPAHYMPYDPTNGTVSFGDMFRFGP